MSAYPVITELKHFCLANMFKARFLARNLCPKLIEHCVFFMVVQLSIKYDFLHVPGMDMLFLNMRLDAQ